MNQYEAGYQDLKPHKPTQEELEDIFRNESALDQRDINESREAAGLAPIGHTDPPGPCYACRATTEPTPSGEPEPLFLVVADGTAFEGDDGEIQLDIAPVEDRHFFPVQTKDKTTYEVIWGPKDEQASKHTDWDAAYAEAKAAAKAYGRAITIQETTDREWSIG